MNGYENFHLIHCTYSVVSFSREQLAITHDHVVHDEDIPDWSFVDTTPQNGERSGEAPAGVGERGSHLKRRDRKGGCKSYLKENRLRETMREACAVN